MIQSRLPNNKWILPAFYLILLILYYPTIGSGFVTDVTGGIESISTRPFSDILISFGFPALNQLSILLFYLLYYLFETSGLGWYLIYCLLHAINAFLLYKLAAALLSAFKVKRSAAIALGGAFLFLISPYQSEVLVWKACQNYLLSTLFILLCLGSTWRYLQSSRRKHLYAIQLFFILALFTFELSLALPFLILVLMISRKLYLNKTTDLIRNTGLIFLPQLIGIGLYFGLNRLVFGQWIGHYGAKMHLSFSPEILMANSQKFLLKYLGFVRMLDHDPKTAIFNFIEANAIPGFIFLFFLLLALLLISLRKQHNTLGFLLTFIVLFFIALLPVLNLYFYHLQLLENDRHAYLASAFFFIALSFILFQLPGFLRTIGLSGYLIASLFFLIQLNQKWSASTKVFDGLIEDFRWPQEEKIFVLNVPDNFQGIYLFRIIGEGSGFGDALRWVGEKPFEGSLTEVVQYNMTGLSDGVKVEQLEDQKIKVIFNQWGNWFWRNGIGAGKGYENEYYKVVFEGHWYELQFKDDAAENAVLIYQDGGKWKEFKLRNQK